MLLESDFFTRVQFILIRVYSMSGRSRSQTQCDRRLGPSVSFDLRISRVHSYTVAVVPHHLQYRIPSTLPNRSYMDP